MLDGDLLDKKKRSKVILLASLSSSTALGVCWKSGGRLGNLVRRTCKRRKLHLSIHQKMDLSLPGPGETTGAADPTRSKT